METMLALLDNYKNKWAERGGGKDKQLKAESVVNIFKNRLILKQIWRFLFKTSHVECLSF